jgi:2,3-dihydroxybenzoate decarboxylase
MEIRLPDTQHPARPQAMPYRRIATEEAWAPQALLNAYERILRHADADAGFRGLMGFYMSSPSERARHIMRCLSDLDALRLQHMDEAGIDMAVVGITAPGVQVLDTETAVALAREANDELAEAVRRHPTRLAGMIAVAPQDPAAAAREIERGVSKLGMHAVIINSHTQGQYLSDPKFWDIFAAAEACDAAIYLHPNALPPSMLHPFQECGLDGAIYGFGVETGLHALRIITAGVFDRFPRLRMVLGHMGEALPYWAYRLDYMHQATVKSDRYLSMRALRRRPSEYLRENFWITSSGVAWEHAIKFAQGFLGEDRVMYAMDYPYQYAPDEVNILDAMDMPLEVKRKFFQTNAETVFKLGH